MPRKGSGKNLELYLNQEMRRGIRVWNSRTVDAGGEELSERQFVQQAVVDKLKRELDSATRAEHADPLTGNKKYSLAGEVNEHVFSEQKEREEDGG